MRLIGSEIIAGGNLRSLRASQIGELMPEDIGDGRTAIFSQRSADHILESPISGGNYPSTSGRGWDFARWWGSSDCVEEQQRPRFSRAFRYPWPLASRAVGAADSALLRRIPSTNCWGHNALELQGEGGICARTVTSARGKAPGLS